MSKHCGHHDYCEKRKLYRRLFGALLALIILILFIILLIFLILRPTKPRYTLQDLTLNSFNITPPNFITSNFQVTLVSRNPNDKIGIYYDKLDIYITYRSQQITRASLIPPTYQGHKEVIVWSPILYGDAVPVAPYLAVALNQDQVAGTTLINIKAYGRLRWKVGSFISGRYHLYVNCPAYITFGNKNTGVLVGSVMKYQLFQNCNVDV